MVQPEDPKSSFHHSMHNVEEDDDVKSEEIKKTYVSVNNHIHTHRRHYVKLILHDLYNCQNKQFHGQFT